MTRGTVRLLVLGALGVLGCASHAPRRELTVGSHHVFLALEEGWQVIDLGSKVILRKDAIELELLDLGPVGRLGVRREIERARRLWRSGRSKDARWTLRTMRVPASLFATDTQRQTFWGAWSEISRATDGAEPAAIDAAFERLLAQAVGLADRSIDRLADDVLAISDDHRRDVARRHRRAVDGRPAVVVDTWNRLTHQDRRRAVLVFDDGYALALRVGGEIGLPEALPALGSMLATLRFSEADSSRVAAVSAHARP